LLEKQNYSRIDLDPQVRIHIFKTFDSVWRNSAAATLLWQGSIDNNLGWAWTFELWDMFWNIISLTNFVSIPRYEATIQRVEIYALVPSQNCWSSLTCMR